MYNKMNFLDLVKEYEEQGWGEEMIPKASILSDPLPPSKETEYDVLLRGQQVERALNEAGITSKVVGVSKGNQATIFEVELPPDISVRTLLDKEEELEKVLAPNSKMRFLTPIIGKRAVGIELPNPTNMQIAFKDMLNKGESYVTQPSVVFPLGKDLYGKTIDCDISRTQNLLIAGGTLNERATFINNLVLSLVFRLPPQNIRFLMVGEGLSRFDGLPHSLTDKAISSNDEAISRLEWVSEEVKRRYEILKSHSVRSTNEYNDTLDVDLGKKERLPHIVVLIDGLSSIMKSHRHEFEHIIFNTSQIIRAAGIYYVLLTDDLSKDVTSLGIKANFASQIAFVTKDYIESRAILSLNGAEKLLGDNDLLYYALGVDDPVRIQGVNATNRDVGQVMDFFKNQLKS